MEHLIMLVGVIAWPICIFFTIKNLFAEVDKHLKTLADKRLDETVRQYEQKNAELNDKLQKITEQVTIIQNGLQWKK
jgi:hypothetical protein